MGVSSLSRNRFVIPRTTFSNRGFSNPAYASRASKAAKVPTPAPTFTNSITPKEKMGIPAGLTSAGARLAFNLFGKVTLKGGVVVRREMGPKKKGPPTYIFWREADGIIKVTTGFPPAPAETPAATPAAATEAGKGAKKVKPPKAPKPELQVLTIESNVALSNFTGHFVGWKLDQDPVGKALFEAGDKVWGARKAELIGQKDDLMKQMTDAQTKEPKDEAAIAAFSRMLIPILEELGDTTTLETASKPWKERQAALTTQKGVLIASMNGAANRKPTPDYDTAIKDGKTLIPVLKELGEDQLAATVHKNRERFKRKRQEAATAATKPKTPAPPPRDDPDAPLKM